MKNTTFGRLLKGAIGSIAVYEGKTAPAIEDDLGHQIGLAGASIQRYKAGHIPPETRTIEILAEAAVKRGYLNREWLQNFLRAAYYPSPEKLLDRLCPSIPIRPRPLHVYENLPAPTYSQFVMRREPYDEVLDGLRQRSAVVLIASLGGMGKTSLAREVAARCLQDDSDAPRFDAVVWVSDKDRPGTTTLNIVLDEIARTLDYPGFTQFEHEEKLREVEQLLRRQRVLLVIDNFETITDGALLAWLLRLPEPSKAMVTTREYRREFRRGTWPIELRGMNEAEAQQFISQRLRLLRIEKMISDPSQIAPLIIATGGNPKALEMALGYLKYQHRPLQQVVDDLYAARGDLFDDLFTRSWALLDEAARRVLLAMTLFPSDASVEALAATADVQSLAFDNAVERLIDLALLDVQQADLNSAPRYALHPLVRAFAGAKLREQPGFEVGARERWLSWYLQLASRVGYCWNDLSKLQMLDPEREMAYSVFKWTFQNQRYAETLQLARGIEYYYYERGLWDKSPFLNLMRAEAARKLNDSIEETRALAYYVQVLSKQGNTAEVVKYLPRLHEVAQSTQLPSDIFFEYHFAIALYWKARTDVDAAQEALQKVSSVVDEILEPYGIYYHEHTATFLYQKGKLDEARQLFHETLHDAVQRGYTRGIISIQIRLAEIDLDRGALEATSQTLAEIAAKAYQFEDRGHIAEIQRLYARLHALRGDLPAACAALTEAIDLFERLGLRRELAEAREELLHLDNLAASEPDGTRE